VRAVKTIKRGYCVFGTDLSCYSLSKKKIMQFYEILFTPQIITTPHLGLLRTQASNRTCEHVKTTDCTDEFWQFSC